MSLHVLFFLVNFCLLLVFFLRDVLGSNVAVRGGNLLVSMFFFATVPACRGFFVSVSTDARGTRGWLGSGGEHWPYMIAADVQRIIPAYTPHSTSQFVCYHNVEKDGAENGVSLWPIFSRNGIQQWHLAMALASIQPWHPSNGTQQWHAWWHPAMALQQ